MTMPSQDARPLSESQEIQLNNERLGENSSGKDETIESDCRNVITRNTVLIYHEKQEKELCALHALNNLFQDSKAFTKQMLDEICHRLCPDTNVMNPHKSIVPGLGNYDVNVIMAALHMNGCEAVWFDKRRSLDRLMFSNILGFILNVPTDLRWGFLRLPVRRKHWISIRKIGLLFYNLDSKLDLPEVIGGEENLQEYLREVLICKDTELILVVVGDPKKIWKAPDPDAVVVSPAKTGKKPKVRSRSLNREAGAKRTGPRTMSSGREGCSHRTPTKSPLR